MEAKCPKCGYLIPIHYKEWDMKTWKNEPLKAYMFNCPSCGSRFRVVKRT
jgi:uncharacterized protein YlaI